MGFRYGSALRKHGFKLPEVSAQVLESGDACEVEVSKHFPEVLEEIRGFAEGCQLNYEPLRSFILTVGLVEPPKRCSIFSAADSSKVMFARNYDFYYRFSKHTESYLTAPKGGYKSLGTSDVFVGREDGVNENALAVGISSVSSTSTGPGMSFVLAVRYILDKCKSVQEATEFLTRIRTATANNYLLADRSGSMVVVEAAHERVNVRKPENGARFVAATNHFVSEEMRALENLDKRPPDSEKRYDAITRALSQTIGGLEQKAIKEILSDHAGLVCSHIETIQLGTLWSIIANLTKLKILRAEGHPCNTKFQQDTRLPPRRVET
jgi:predicted choloylglycine hydrolase